MHNYISRNGVTEQTFYYRQQPRHLQHLPFDFQIDEEQRHKAILDRAVVAVCVICALALYIWAYAK